jgi:integrase
LNLLRRALQDAADEGHATSNVAKDVEVPKKPRADDGWTWLRAEEIEAVLRARPRASTPAQRDAITLAIYTGLRAGELWGLRWCDATLDGPRPELHVRRNRSGPTKSGQDRHVPLLPMAVEALRSRRAASPGVGAALVFPGKKGKPHGEGYDAGWPSWKRAAGIARRVRFHDLRHTCASHLVQGTWTTRPLRLEDVRQWGGWSTIKMCERYAHLAPEALHSYLDGVVRPVTPAKEHGP